MAKISGSFSVYLSIISLLIILYLPKAVSGIPDQELYAMISSLRSKGYNLFSNALIVSDLRYEIYGGNSFTVFAPTDSALFALDMTATASDYVQTLRCHVAARRYSTRNLRTLPSGSFLRTLHPRHRILISHLGNRFSESDFLTADGVDVVLPGLFYGENIAVHGLNGILSLRPPIVTRYAPQPSDLPRDQNFPPRSTEENEEDHHSPEIQPPFTGFSPESSHGSQDSSYPMISPLAHWPDLGSPRSDSPGYQGSSSPMEQKLHATPPNEFYLEIPSPSESDDLSSRYNGYQSPMQPYLRTKDPGMHDRKETDFQAEGGFHGEHPATQMSPHLRDESPFVEIPSPVFSWHNRVSLDEQEVESSQTTDDKDFCLVNCLRANIDPRKLYNEDIF